MRLDDLRAVLKIRSYFRKIHGKEPNPTAICTWLEALLKEIETYEKDHPKSK